MKAELADPRVLEAAADLLGFAGELLDQIEFGGARLAVTFEVVEEEHRRRDLEHLGAVSDRDLWDVLASLPYRYRIPWASIGPIASALLDVIPSGIVLKDEVAVERIIRPAVRITGALSVDSQWRRAIDRASRFSAHSSRAALLPSPISKQGIQRARTLGIGLVTASERQLEVKLRPAPTVPVPGPRNFRLCEAVYAAWLKAASSRSAPRP